MFNANWRDEERVEGVMRRKRKARQRVTLISQEENEMRQYLVC